MMTCFDMPSMAHPDLIGIACMHQLSAAPASHNQSTVTLSRISPHTPPGARKQPQNQRNGVTRRYTVQALVPPSAPGTQHCPPLLLA
jgi:hypothetical protein